jgi:acetyl esterase/lipase
MTERRDVLGRTARPPDLTVRYGTGPDRVADVWLPRGLVAEPGYPGRLPGAGGVRGARSRAGPRVGEWAPGVVTRMVRHGERPSHAPLVILVHGGFWRQKYDRAHIAPLAAALAAHGHPVASVEYRRAGSGGAGGWPHTFTDVAAAMDAVPALVAAAAPEQVGAGPPCYAGHSAGGHLALWAALRHRLPPGAPGRRDSPPAVGGVLALAPVCDLAEAYRRNLDLGAAGLLVGAAPAQAPERYAAVNPATLPAPDAPTTLLHGRADGRVPVVLSREYAASHPVHLVELDGVDHFSLIDPESAAWPVVLSELRALESRSSTG